MKNPLERIKDVFVAVQRFAESDMDSMETSEERHEGGEDYVTMSHPDAGELQTLKSAIKGHGEQTVLPDDCQYGDNDLCDVET